MTAPTVSLFVADTSNRAAEATFIPEDGSSPSSRSLGVASIAGFAGDTSRNVYFASYTSGGIRRENVSGGSMTTYSTGNESVDGIAVDKAGDVFATCLHCPAAEEYPHGSTGSRSVMSPECSGGSGMGATIPPSCPLSNAEGIAVDQHGNVFIADTGHNRVVEVPGNGGAQSTVASGLQSPRAVAVDANGDVYILDGSGLIRVAPGGHEAQVQTGTSAIGWIASDAAGDLYLDDEDHTVIEQTPSGSRRTVMTGLSQPELLAVMPWA